MLLIHHLAGNRATLLDQRVVTLHVDDGAVEQRLILLLHGDLLLQLRLQRPGIDDGKHVALFDVLAFLETGFA